MSEAAVCDIFTEKDGSITIMTNEETIMISPDKSKGYLISIIDYEGKIHQWPQKT